MVFSGSQGFPLVPSGFLESHKQNNWDRNNATARESMHTNRNNATAGESMHTDLCTAFCRSNIHL